MVNTSGARSEAGDSVTKCFCLHSKRDADILRFLAGQDSRGQSALVRQALRLYMERAEIKRPAMNQEEIVEACRRAIRLELAGRLAVQGDDTDSELILASSGSEEARNLAALETRLEEW